MEDEWRMRQGESNKKAGHGSGLLSGYWLGQEHCSYLPSFPLSDFSPLVVTDSGWWKVGIYRALPPGVKIRSSEHHHLASAGGILLSPEAGLLSADTREERVLVGILN